MIETALFLATGLLVGSMLVLIVTSRREARSGTNPEDAEIDREYDQVLGELAAALDGASFLTLQKTAEAAQKLSGIFPPLTDRPHPAATGLLLRTPFLERTAASLSEARRHGTDLSMVIVRWEESPNASDRNEPDAAVPQQRRVGLLLRGILRKGDVAGDLGPDQIGILLHATHFVGALGAVNRVQDGLQRHRAPLAIHAGIASCPRPVPKEYTETSLYADALEACGAAQRSGAFARVFVDGEARGGKELEGVAYSPPQAPLPGSPGKGAELSAEDTELLGSVARLLGGPSETDLRDELAREVVRTAIQVNEALREHSSAGLRADPEELIDYFSRELAKSCRATGASPPGE